jgi:hypothetical protein
VTEINIHLMLHEFSYKDDVYVVGPQSTGWDICSTVVVGGKVKVDGWLESNADLWTLKCWDCVALMGMP